MHKLFVLFIVCVFAATLAIGQEPQPPPPQQPQQQQPQPQQPQAQPPQPERQQPTERPREEPAGGGESTRGNIPLSWIIASVVVMALVLMIVAMATRGAGTPVISERIERIEHHHDERVEHHHDDTHRAA